MVMFGKKSNDPEKNNYDVVICDNTGKLLVYKTFKVGDPQRSDFIPYYILADDDKFWFFGYYTDGVGPGLVVKTLTADGSEVTKIFSKKDITPLRVYEKSQSDQERNEYEGVGFTYGPEAGFTGMGHTITANGDLLIWGRASSETSDPDYNRQTGGASGLAPRVVRYRDFICLQFSSANGLVAVYGSKLTPTFDSVPISMISANDKIIFGLVDGTRPPSALESQIFEIPSLLAPDSRTRYPYKQLYTPKFVSVTPATPKIESAGPSTRDLTLFNPKKYSVVAMEKSAIYYYGYTLSKGTAPMRLWVEEFKF